MELAASDGGIAAKMIAAAIANAIVFLNAPKSPTPITIPRATLFL
jgi:hypothetical protein